MKWKWITWKIIKYWRISFFFIKFFLEFFTQRNSEQWTENRIYMITENKSSNRSINNLTERNNTNNNNIFITHTAKNVKLRKIGKNTITITETNPYFGWVAKYLWLLISVSFSLFVFIFHLLFKAVSNNFPLHYNKT